MKKDKSIDNDEIRHVDAGIEFPRSSLIFDDRRFDVKPEKKHP